MTAFDDKGCQLQMESETMSEAQRRFEYSCECCCTKGRRIPCDRCPIAATHEAVMKSLKVCREVTVTVTARFSLA